MNHVMRARQRGLSFESFIVVAILGVIVGIFSLKLVPAYMEDGKIKTIFNAIAHDPDMQKASPYEIKLSFDRRASIDNITAIKAEDIEIASEQGRLILSAKYSVKVGLGGNVSLLLEFNPTNDR